MVSSNSSSYKNLTFHLIHLVKQKSHFDKNKKYGFVLQHVFRCCLKPYYGVFFYLKKISLIVLSTTTIEVQDKYNNITSQDNKTLIFPILVLQIKYMEFYLYNILQSY